MLRWARGWPGGTAPGLGSGVTGLGGPSGTGLGLPVGGCGGGQSGAVEEEDEEDEVVVADTPSFGDAMRKRGQWFWAEEAGVGIWVG